MGSNWNHEIKDLGKIRWQNCDEHSEKKNEGIL